MIYSVLVGVLRALRVNICLRKKKLKKIHSRVVCTTSGRRNGDSAAVAAAARMEPDTFAHAVTALRPGLSASISVRNILTGSGNVRPLI